MSSKKIYTTLGLNEEVFEKIKADALRERRSRGFIVDKILREHYDMPSGGGIEETAHANKS